MNTKIYNELYKKYKLLLQENENLKVRIKELEEKSRSFEHQYNRPQSQSLLFKETCQELHDNQHKKEFIKVSVNHDKTVNKYSTNEDKIALFMSLFKGRDDVYAKRWQNKKGISGYSPVCLNEWKPGVCDKPKIKCSKCSQKLYKKLDKKTVEAHLRGDIIIGVYPMNMDETCFFLALDFDKENWQKDISAIKNTCDEFGIPIAVEKSRSGNGGHVWFFFNDKISASTARKFGASLLTYSMSKRYEISFKSYDRLFPNQDTMPKGGLGNLIAFPLQLSARKNGNTLFVDKKFDPYSDQWKFLNDIQKLSEEELNYFIARLSKGNELGLLKSNEEPDQKPWKKTELKIQKQDFPETVEIVASALMYINKTGISQRALNTLKRFAAFKNPDFYKSQAMRIPTYNKPRVISCSDDFKSYLGLPRGCEDDVISLLNELEIKVKRLDETNSGRAIHVKFNGSLREEQQKAIEALKKHNNGVLSATTAFGKTVIGAKLISLRKVNTLVLVHRRQLMSQWIEKLSQFLIIDETLPELPKKRGRNKKQSVIGQLGAGKHRLSSIVDVALMQSLYTAGEVKECIKNYGMIIVDECHHVPAISFEQILKEATSKYVYGLSATPYRADGHHPIIFFYCGPIRFETDAKSQAEIRPFDHYVIPRFTSFKMPFHSSQKESSIQEIYSELITDEIRNHLIVDDIVECYENGRNSLVLTGRLAHVESLSESLRKRIPDVITLTGGLGTKKTVQILERISAIPVNQPFVLVATGSFIGEGFDEARLDTLFLAMPVAWKGTLQQYAGRLHRLCENKKDVQIYDYVDIHLRMLEKMYGKRLKGYGAISYKVKVENVPDAAADIIFDKQSFFPVYINDIKSATKQILIVSPYATKKRVIQMMEYFNIILQKQVEITIITRPAKDFNENRRIHLEETFDVLKKAGVNILFKSNIHQKFAVIDQKIIWYGSINLLSFGYSEESIMRLVSGNIAFELTKDIKI